jgi:uncharacterized protein
MQGLWLWRQSVLKNGRCGGTRCVAGHLNGYADIRTYWTCRATSLLYLKNRHFMRHATHSIRHLKISSLASRIVIALIRVYQATLSPDHGIISAIAGPMRCRYYPTCSAYAIDAIECYGLGRGSAMAVRRLLRCHPWGVGGVDTVACRKIKL